MFGPAARLSMKFELLSYDHDAKPLTAKALHMAADRGEKEVAQVSVFVNLVIFPHDLPLF